MSETLNTGPKKNETPREKLKREQDELRADARTLLKRFSSDALQGPIETLPPETRDLYTEAVKNLQAILNEAQKRAPKHYPHRWEPDFKRVGERLRPVLWSATGKGYGISHEGIVVPDSPREFIDVLKDIMIDPVEREQQLRKKLEEHFKRIADASLQDLTALAHDIRTQAQSLPAKDAEILTRAFDDRMLGFFRDAAAETTTLADVAALSRAVGMEYEFISSAARNTALGLLEAAAGTVAEWELESATQWAELQDVHERLATVLGGGRGPVYAMLAEALERKARTMLETDLDDVSRAESGESFFRALDGMMTDIERSTLPLKLKSTLNQMIERRLERHLEEIIDPLETRSDHRGNLDDLNTVYGYVQSRVPLDHPMIGRLRTIAVDRMDSVLDDVERNTALDVHVRLERAMSILNGAPQAEFLYPEVRERYREFALGAASPLIEEAVGTLEARDFGLIRRIRDFLDLYAPEHPRRIELYKRLDARASSLARKEIDSTNDMPSWSATVQAIEGIGPLTSAVVRYADSRAEGIALRRMDAAQTLPALMHARDQLYVMPRYSFRSSFEDAVVDRCESRAAEIIRKQLRDAKTLVLVSAALSTARRYLAVRGAGYQKLEAEAAALVESYVRGRLRQRSSADARQRLRDDVNAIRLSTRHSDRLNDLIGT